jgi:putative endonuclease
VPYLRIMPTKRSVAASKKVTQKTPAAVSPRPQERRKVTKAITWYVYMVRCADGTLYTGITTDVSRRVAEHNGPKAAKYTRSRQPVVLVHQKPLPTRSVALIEEAALKKVTRASKLRLLETGTL